MVKTLQLKIKCNTIVFSFVANIAGSLIPNSMVVALEPWVKSSSNLTASNV